MNLPNKLTVFRIFLIPVFMILLIAQWPAGSFTLAGTEILWSRVVAMIVFAVASATDWFDGHMADKMLTMTAFIFMVELNLAPAWVVAIIVCRELAVTGLRLIVVENNGKVMAAAMPGKIKTTCQMLSIIFLLFGDIFHLGTILLYLALIFTIYSGYDYFHSSWDVFKGSM